MDGRRILVAGTVVLVVVGGITIGLAVRDEESSLAPAVDWSSPAELPPPTRADFRSVFVSEEEGFRFFPRSGGARRGVAYEFDTGHCGLSFLADFDGSFWRPIDPDGGESPDFFINQDVGAIALVGRDGAVYRSSSGIEVRLERITGPVITQPCE
ncbi:MAG: hypothetical protein ACRDGW_05210 [Actinomycetota bacterium]